MEIATEMMHYRAFVRRPVKSQCVPRPNAHCHKPLDWVKGPYLDYTIQYDYYQDLRLGRYSFQRITADLTQPITFRRLKVDDKRSGFKKWLCPSDGQGGCQFGQLVAHERFAHSITGAGNSVPLSFQEVLGGTDLSGQDTLRGFQDLRFRGPDLLLLQAEYIHPIWGPFHSLLFYDAGEVANGIGGVSAAHLRQDWGMGVEFVLQNDPLSHVVFRFTVGFGSGEGVQYKPRFMPAAQGFQ